MIKTFNTVVQTHNMYVLIAILYTKERTLSSYFLTETVHPLSPRGMVVIIGVVWVVVVVVVVAVVVAVVVVWVVVVGCVVVVLNRPGNRIQRGMEGSGRIGWTSLDSLLLLSDSLLLLQ